MFQGFVFNETSPSAPGTAASSKAVASAGNIYAAGIAAPLDDGTGIDVVAILQGATGGALNIYIQEGQADGTWIDVCAFTQLAAAAAQIVYKTNISPVALGTSAPPTQVGMGLSPALTAPATVQGQGFDRLRLVMVAGSGTTAGAPVKVYVTTQRPRLHD
jgi:hypothetical protein